MNIPIENMSVSEKLKAIELIWDSLAANGEDVPTPDWQANELDERQRRLDSGETKISSWDEAEKRFDDLGK